jgi:hypothetical protein
MKAPMPKFTQPLATSLSLSLSLSLPPSIPLFFPKPQLLPDLAVNKPMNEKTLRKRP